LTHALAPYHNISVIARSDEKLKQVTVSAGEFANNITAYPCDVSSLDNVSQTFSSASEKWGSVDVLINCAGIGVWKDLADMKHQDFVDQININLIGTFNCVKAVLPEMITQRSGMIITINSIATQTSYPGNAAYGASKAGVLAMTRVLRNEVRQHGIKVCDVILGATASELWDREMLEMHSDGMMIASDVVPVVEMLVQSLANPRLQVEEILVRPQNGDL